MRILLTGGSGQLGWELARALASLGEVYAPPRAVLDLARPETLGPAVRDSRADAIVNAGAYTEVERAEREEPLASVVNGLAPGVLAEEARRLGAQLVHFSTDYVFDGRKSGPYVEEDSPGPINAYGRSKLAGERAVQAAGGDALVLRTSWLYSGRGRNFMLTMLRKAGSGEALRVVNDQTGTPTWTRQLAQATAALLGRGERLRGLYHVSAAGAATWHAFAQAIVAAAGLDVPVEAITSAQYPSAAARPASSVLSGAKLEREFGVRLDEWRDALAACIAELRAAAR